jgi:hypothetical protein
MAIMAMAMAMTLADGEEEEGTCLGLFPNDPLF